MRISSGKSRGRKIAHDKSRDLRPTSAKVREAVFNIVQRDIEGASFVDLFAGTGAVGIEALSRGAAEVTFVESKEKRTRALREVLESFGLSERSRIVTREAIAFLKGYDGPGFDILFADPPYRYEGINELIRIIYNRNMVREGGTLIIEHASKSALPRRIGNIVLRRRYHYGDTVLSRYGREHE